MSGRPDPADTAEARFEAMLSQVLTTDEEAREHEAAKGTRTTARQRAAGAKATSQRNRERALKSRKREPKRGG
jgi:hypothetical protein